MAIHLKEAFHFEKKKKNSHNTHSFIICSVLPDKMDSSSRRRKHWIPPAMCCISHKSREWLCHEKGGSNQLEGTFCICSSESQEQTWIPCSFLIDGWEEYDCSSQTIKPLVSESLACMCVCVCVRRVWQLLFVVHGKRILANETIPVHSEGDELS